MCEQIKLLPTGEHVVLCSGTGNSGSHATVVFTRNNILLRSKCYFIGLCLARLEFPIFVHCQYLFCPLSFYYFVNLPNDSLLRDRTQKRWKTKDISHSSKLRRVDCQKVFREHSVKVRGNSPPICQAGRKVGTCAG